MLSRLASLPIRPKPVAAPSTFPSTRYQGSKRKLAAAIAASVADLRFHTVLDAFGGTGAVAHAFKLAGKAVTYNDVLGFNHQIGLALIENDDVRLDGGSIESIAERRPGVSYGDFIERTFPGIYFTDEENGFLDTAVGNIRRLRGRYRRALAWFALFQAAMVKRPYNLFHRRNLYMRTATVRRTFGNKSTWDGSFPHHFRRFAEEANRAVFAGGAPCRAACADALTLPPDYDLVYVDTPYVNGAGVGVNYHAFYHFLEGLVNYESWAGDIDGRSPHKRLQPVANPFSDRRTCTEAFQRLFQRFGRSILLVSYRSDGIPSIAKLADLLRSVKRHVRLVDTRRYQYALSTNRTVREMLLIGT
ncbi:MAG: DNA adenine methylase [Planctomycetes bacterium]|nr:DNA adenine methylase [Planctomycetota bacterium]